MTFAGHFLAFLAFFTNDAQTYLQVNLGNL